VKRTSCFLAALAPDGIGSAAEQDRAPAQVVFEGARVELAPPASVLIENHLIKSIGEVVVAEPLGTYRL